ncbi:hypothetical protein AAB992_37575 [Burkholderia contaminans]|nr:hypothetical protein [Burkholderia contaminans]WFN15049.1 hypothetical protein LXE92_33065 [Burkholderia contaminans]
MPAPERDRRAGRVSDAVHPLSKRHISGADFLTADVDAIDAPAPVKHTI